MDTERDLLLGLLAVQEKHINLDQYASACRIWASESVRPLAGVLQDYGWIDAGVRTGLERGVAARIAVNPASPALTMEETVAPTLGATIELPPDHRLASTLVDPAGQNPSPIAATLMVPADGDSDGVGEPNALGSRSASRYTLLKVYGEGGLGRVWRARDNDLNREVALKEIQPHLARSETKVRRFLLEAQVTGQLEHPNIVPVYELGHRPQDGQPFYTMRFVRGATLSEAIAEYHEGRRENTVGRLEFARLLGRFYGVCYAVGYAHSRGVIHRDLKPENVVLGDYGEVNLLDWGLAKLVEIEESSDESSIHLSPDAALCDEGRGGIEGTPAYMAPEQIDATFGPLGTHADIYGLGSILFEILTGFPPHRGESVTKLLDQIVAQETPSARRLEPSVHPALDAICAKAMAKDQAQRYARAGDIALDLQRFITDEPVTAYREPPLERAARWARRHRTWTQAAAVALILVTFVSIFASVLINGAQRAEASARRDAEGRYEQARGFADTLLAGVSEDLKDVPGAEGIQKKLLEKASEAYQGFASERSSDPALELKSGQALLRLAEVRNLIHDLDGAVRSCQEAEQVFDDLSRRNPAALLPARWRAQSLAMWGRVLNNAQKNEDALVPYFKAISQFDALAIAHPHDAELLDHRAECAVGLALVLQELHQYEKAETTYQAALKDYDHLIQDALDEQAAKGTTASTVNPAYRSHRARGLINLATLLNAQTKLLTDAKKTGEADQKRKQAEQACRAAIADLEILVRSDAEVPEYLYQLASSRNNLGLYLKDQGDIKDAEVAFGASVDRYETLLYKKTVPKNMNGLVRARQNLADSLARSHIDDAEDLLRAALYDSKILARVHPDDPTYLTSLAENYYSYGMLQRDQKKNNGEALKAFNRAVEIWKQLKSRDQTPAAPGEKSRSDAGLRLRTTLFWRSVTLLDLAQVNAVIADLEVAPDLAPDNADDQYNVACAWSRASAQATVEADRRTFSARALTFLRRAIELNPSFALQIGFATGPNHDPDLDPIRVLPEFKALIKSAKP